MYTETLGRKWGTRSYLYPWTRIAADVNWLVAMTMTLILWAHARKKLGTGMTGTSVRHATGKAKTKEAFRG